MSTSQLTVKLFMTVRPLWARVSSNYIYINDSRCCGNTEESWTSMSVFQFIIDK